MADDCEICSKEKILNAAENAFADLGFEGASLRNIVQSAEVNLATVYYYFGSKEGLMNAVLQRLFGPIKEQQLELLTRLMGESSEQPATVEKILEAILAPAMHFSMTKSVRNEVSKRLIGRILTDPNPMTQGPLICQHQQVREIYTAALHQAIPDLPMEDLMWRMEFVWGAISFMLCNPSRFEQHTKGKCGSIEENLLPQMIACFSAGLRAPGVKIR